VADLALPDDLGSPRLLTELTKRSTPRCGRRQQGWLATMEDGPGEAESGCATTSESRVAAQGRCHRHGRTRPGREFARPGKLPADLVARVLSGLRYKPGWTFEPAVLPDGTVAVRGVTDLEDHVHPGSTFRTSRSAPLRVTGSETPAEVVVDAALRAVPSIEEHEIREQLLLDGRRSQPLDPHQFPAPTNTAPRDI
jgi:hypothetical protein